jgi:hypothetical protein
MRNATVRRTTLIALGAALIASVSHARDSGQYADISTEIKEWVESLTDRLGTSCCATADGFEPEEVEWEMAANRSRVRIRGEWMTVPDGSVIKQANRLGHAVLWLHEEPDGIAIRCFLPGPAS